MGVTLTATGRTCSATADGGRPVCRSIRKTMIRYGSSITSRAMGQALTPDNGVAVSQIGVTADELSAIELNRTMEAGEGVFGHYPL